MASEASSRSKSTKEEKNSKRFGLGNDYAINIEIWASAV